METTASTVAGAVEQVRADSATSRPEPRRVGARDGERVLADVGATHVEVGRSSFSASATAPLPGADVDHARAGGQAERRLDQELGLRARDQHARVDLELDAAEAAAAEEVGDRLAADRPAADEVLERAHGRPGDLALGRHDERRAVHAERMAEQQLGVEPRRVRARRRDRTMALSRASRTGTPRATGHQTDWAACASSPRRFSSALSASVNSSSSPSRTSSRLWLVSLMRWSVTRRSPKL